MKNKLLLLLGFFLFLVNQTTAQVFQDYSYGDSAEQIREIIGDKCQIQPVKKDTRWEWRSQMGCYNFDYKGINSVIYFQFSDEDLNRISIVSKKIPNFFLFRDAKNRYLLSKAPLSDLTENSNNLVDKLIFQDKVHYQKDGQKLTYFFYKGEWEWELLFEKEGYQKNEKRQIREQLKEESKKGVKGWKSFQFNLSSRDIRTRLEGLCSKISHDKKAVFQGIKRLVCHDFSFLDQKISINFKFYDNKLVTINLLLPTSFYQTLLPLLKEKYGTPYIEYENDQDYYPYIIFPANNLELCYIKSQTQKALLSLKYIKKGYIDPVEIKQFKEKTDKKRLKKIKSKSEVIMDNI